MRETDYRDELLDTNRRILNNLRELNEQTADIRKLLTQQNKDLFWIKFYIDEKRKRW